MQGCLRYPYPIRNPPLRLARRCEVPAQSCDQLRALLVSGIIPRGSIPHRSDSTTAAGAFKKASYNYEQLLSRL
jgi:hypothetical protein